MKYLKLFEYQTNTVIGPLGKIYPGRFIDTIGEHCEMLDSRGIKYELYADLDFIGDMDAVLILIDNDSKQLFDQTMKTLGFKQQDMNLLDLNKHWVKFESFEDYLNSKKYNL